jgi:hypothetical protein
MKTSKPISKKVVNTVSSENEENNITADALQPSVEDIREKANEIYLQRLERGEHGTAENDWIEAEKLLRDSGF